MKKSFAALALLILLCAAFLRFWQLSEYPPGPHYDEGAYLLISRSIAFGGARFFPIVEAYQGREVLYMYLAAPLLHLFGDDVFTLRLTSAFSNLVTVAATIALGRAMFRGRRGWVIGLTAGVLIAISFPQFWLARQAFRAVTLPLMQALALVCLWRGLRAQRHAYVWLGVAGVLAAGALYTYMASRLFPFWLALGGIVLLIAGRRDLRHWLPRGLTFFAVLCLAALPMVIYALQRPDIFFARLGEVTDPEQSVSLIESILLHVRMFFIQGDSYFRYNIPNRPYLTPPEGLFMVAGVAAAAGRLFHRGVTPVERAAYALVLLSPLMVIPSVISVGGLPPSHMRSLGMIPLLFILVAVGFEAVIARLPAVFTARRVLLLLTVSLVAGTAYGWSIYRDWASNALVYYENDADLAAAADWLIGQETTGILENNLIYVAARDRGHPTVMIRPVPPITWLGTDSLFWPPFDQSATYIFPRSAPPPADWRALLEENAAALFPLPLGPDRRQAFEAFRVLMGTVPPAPVQAGDADIRNPYVSWAGTDVVELTTADGHVTVRWRIDNVPPYSDLTPILQVEDDQGVVLSRSDVYVTETDRWVPGSVLFQRLRVSLHPATAGGNYRMRMAWVSRERDEYVSYLNADGTLAGIWADVGTVRVRAPFVSVSPVPVSFGIENLLASPVLVSDGFQLLGWDAQASTHRPGEALSLSLYWQVAGRPSSFDYRIVMQSDGGEPVELYQGAPVRGTSPVTEWQDAQIVRDPLLLQTPRDVMPGVYDVVLETPQHTSTLARITIEGIARQVDRPVTAVDVDQSYGAEISLTGYTLTRTEGQIRLQLVWQAESDGGSAYTYFVHLVDESGAILDQVDAVPRQNSYPTTLWAAGEYVDDEVVLNDAPASRALRVGWYDPQTGRRLILESGADFFEISLDP